MNKPYLYIAGFAILAVATYFIAGTHLLNPSMKYTILAILYFAYGIFLLRYLVSFFKRS